MANSKQIVYLSQTQYAELIANGTITANGVTVTYDENDIYVTPQAEPVTDVRVAGTSVAANGVADIPIASGTPGVVKVSTNASFGVIIGNDGMLRSGVSSEAQVKTGTHANGVISPVRQHIATFYGLAKAAGRDEKDSTEPLGAYTPEAKGAIQKMLGVSDLIATEENNLTASKAYAIGDIFTANGKLYKATAAIAQDAAIILPGSVGENCEEVSVADGFVKKTDYATVRTYGIVKPGNGLLVNSSNVLSIATATEAECKSQNGSTGYQPITVFNQHAASFYGLAKAAGDATQSQSSNTIGTYTSEAKTAIQTMLDVPNKAAVTTIETKVDSFVDNAVIVSPTQPTAEDNKIWVNEDASYVEVPTMAEFNALDASAVKDVQVNGTSVVQNGVANVPVASQSNLGVVKGYGIRGVGVDSAGNIYVMPAGNGDIKQGGSTYSVITTTNSYAAAFYGLAKASGDTTQSASSNAVGTYTDNAKASIKAMLGIQDGSTGTVDVSGTTPTITAVENTRYICGEVTSLSFTPPASGIAIVRFTSGTSVTVLTMPSTVKFPEWFDPTSLETDTIYEICVTDGVYGAVMTWPL